MKYEHKSPKFSDREILEMFPESKEIIPMKIEETKKEMRAKKANIKKQLKRLHLLNTDKFSEWFGEEFIKIFTIPDFIILKKRFFRLKRFQQLLSPPSKMTNWFKFEEKIKIAQDYPIEMLARDKLELKQVGKNFISLCPFHEEKTPSFYLYINTNRFYCFGCHEKGNVINLTMALFGLNFKEAVELLQNK